MPGFHIIISNEKVDKDKFESGFESLRHEENMSVNYFINNQNKCGVISSHDSYPFNVWQEDSTTILLTGMIYNYNLEDVRKQIFEIVALVKNRELCEVKISEFVINADGDFVICIFHEGQFILFNDYLGRLPVYYSLIGNTLIVSSELKTILNNISSIELDRYGVFEFLFFEYTLLERTIFKNISRLHYSKMILVDINEEKLNLNIKKSNELVYESKEQFSSKKECIKYLRDSFLTSTKNRIDRLIESNYWLIADLSGGFDSRSVAAGLAKYSRDIDYYTFEYIHDESKFAKETFHILDNPGTYSKLTNSELITDDGIQDLVFKTDGLANYLTTKTCYQDIKSLRKVVKGKTARFSGLGGEFIRHPFIYHDLINNEGKKTFKSEKFILLSKLLALDVADIQNHFQLIVKNFPDVTLNGKLKRFYYEYYHNFVGIAAEDRERIHFWTVQPLWSNKFLSTIFSRVPLKWTGYKFYTEFLKSIDKKLLNVPIYKRDINLKSKINLWHYDLIQRIPI